MAYNFHYTPTGTGVISGKEVLEQTEDAINDLGTQISGDVQTAINTANNALNTANSASADAQNAVNTANTAYTTAQNAQNTANTAQNTASNALTAAQNAQNDVNALGNRVTTAEGNITQNTTDITNLTTRMGTAEGNITTLQSNVSTAQATANSAQQTANTARQQSYVLRYASTSVTPSSTIAYSVLNNTDNIKAGDSVIDSSGQVFLIVSVDSANETVTVGAVLLTLALDANVMHLSGNETAAGKKTFSEYITSDGSNAGGEYSVNAKTNIWLMANRDTEELSGVLFDTFRQNVAQGIATHILGIGIKENAVRYEGCRFSWAWDNNLNGYIFELKPTRQGTNQAVGHSLGSSVDKWDTINGINPGALSLPDLSAGVDISGYLTNAGTTTPSEFTPSVNGWIVLKISADSPAYIRVYSVGGLDVSTYSERNEIGSTSGGSYTRFASLIVPCINNDKLNIILMPGLMTIISAKFYPCQGNV